MNKISFVSLIPVAPCRSFMFWVSLAQFLLLYFIDVKLRGIPKIFKFFAADIK
jgi:hypothetical protein